jgi:hypothetical protein
VENGRPIGYKRHPATGINQDKNMSMKHLRRKMQTGKEDYFATRTIWKK